ncbi:hypothetical protein KXX39_005655 [Aspergillus fumigatus]|nr:hypothetical protein KXX39_005655 [Aspergillus fumigatus]
MSHRSESDLPSPRTVDFDFTKKPELQNLRRPAQISVFPAPSTSPDFMFEPLEPHDATDSYFRTKVRFPTTRDSTGDWAFLNMLLSKAIQQISFSGPIRNVNTYYYKDESALTPSALVLLTAHWYHIIAPREYPLTAAYAKFVNAGLIKHIRQGGKPASLPAGVQNATQDLTKNQNNRIKKHLENEVNRILRGQSAVLDMGPKYKGTSKDVKKFLQEILELAEKANIDNAHAALEKVNSFSPAALETEDIKVSNTLQPGISEPAAPIGAAAAQVKETKPKEESREDEAPGAALPEEEIPEEESPQEESPQEESPQEESPEEEAPGVASPKDEAPGVASPELQPRSGVHTYRKGRRFPAGETAEAFKTENIP